MTLTISFSVSALLNACLKLVLLPLLHRELLT